MDEREKFRQELAKDILIALIQSGNTVLGWTPGRPVTFSTIVVNNAKTLTDYFMAEIYDGGKEG